MATKRARTSSIPVPAPITGRPPAHGWGGWRPGAGRKPKGAFSGVSHLARPRITRATAALVTFALVPGLPSLRERAAGAVVRRALGAVHGRRGFRLLAPALFPEHLHLVVHVKSTAALSHAMKSLCVRLARGLNGAWGRRGDVFADRYEVRVLRDERELRAAKARPCAWRLPPGTALRNRPPSCRRLP